MLHQRMCQKGTVIVSEDCLDSFFRFCVNAGTRFRFYRIDGTDKMKCFLK